MIHELDSVVLTVDLPEHRLQRGDVGTVVLLHEDRDYEVEFVALDGETLRGGQPSAVAGSAHRCRGNRARPIGGCVARAPRTSRYDGSPSTSIAPAWWLEIV